MHKCHCGQDLYEEWTFNAGDHLACPEHGYVTGEVPEPSAEPKPLDQHMVGWLRSYAAGMWQAMRDDVDAEEFRLDRDRLCEIADAIDAALKDGK